jgi:hypothetical protein
MEAKIKPTQILTIQFAGEKEKSFILENLYVDLLFFISGRYCYGFRFGPTNVEGKLHIKYHDVESERVKAAKYNLMDYNTPLDHCDDILKIKLPSADELRKAYEWQTESRAGGVSTEAESWVNAANSKVKCEETSVELKGTETVVSIRCSSAEP